MKTPENIKSAIARSVSHNEIVRVEVDWPQDRAESSAEEIILDWLDELGGVKDHDCAQENDGSYDVWGTTKEGEDFRIRLVHQ